jgi:predicted KAP-like P-loop ATPase
MSTNGDISGRAPEVTQSTSSSFALWPDDPSDTDLLSFDAVAATVTGALLDDNLDPVALGVSGRWGSGKTTVLKLVEQQVKAQNTSESKVVVVSSLPWRYDPTTGAKESLIAEVLESLKSEIAETQTTGGKAKELLERLVKRVDWAKAIRLAVKTGVTFQIPSIDNLLDLVKAPEDAEESVRGLEAFRDEFKALMASDELEHVRCVVVLVDDLDRCLHETVIDTLEAIRLFLAVPKMSFVIAADEERVADAIRTRFKDVASERADGGGVRVAVEK